MADHVVKPFKSILNKRRFIDGWFWDRYSVNPYNGCQFGCVYCNSRSDRYRMPEDFENRIVVKEDAAAMLDRRLSRARTLLPDVVAIAGVTDGYQPAERQFRSTRQILEVLRTHRYPVHIITKSRLVLEDVELLEAIGSDTWCTVSVTLSTTDREIARFLDKHAPDPAIRLDIVRTLREKAPHVQVGVLAIPVVPFLGDTDEHLEQLAGAVADAGGKYLLFGGGMTLRDVQADWFLSNLETRFPDLVPRYESLFGFRHGAGPYDGSHVPDPAHMLRIHQKLFGLCATHELPWRIPRFVPDDFRATNYRLAERFLNDAHHRQMLGQPWQDLHWAGHNIQNLDEAIEDVAARGELTKIRNVRGVVLEEVERLLART